MDPVRAPVRGRAPAAAPPPLAVVADTEILANAPWELTTAGCADIISNYTAVKDWRLAKRLKNVEFSEYSAALSEMTAEMLVDSADSIKPGLEESAWIVVKALVSSGVAMSIAGSSRPASGAEHLFSHQLDRIAPGKALHGHQVGVGSILTGYLHGGRQGEWRDIQRALQTLMTDRTVIAVAHRLSTLAGMDRILVLEEGAVIEEGNHEDLLNADGAYARMWQLQSEGYLALD